MFNKTLNLRQNQSNACHQQHFTLEELFEILFVFYHIVQARYLRTTNKTRRKPKSISIKKEKEKKIQAK